MSNLDIDVFKDAVRRGAGELSLNIDDEAIDLFSAYFVLLTERNRVMNLTAITGAANTASLHFLDSLALFGAAEFINSRVIDIGSGAGFPGLPIKIAEKSVDLSLVESNGKKVAFLNDVVSELRLSGVSCLNARAEEIARSDSHRESYDYAVSRAVASLPVLLELCLPFVKVGGAVLSMKSENSGGEIDEARRAVTELGGELESVFEYTLPIEGIKRRVVVLRKVRNTPDIYPRRFPKIQKFPL